MALTTVRSTGIGSLPAISGANLTSLNASNISSGTLSTSRYVQGSGAIKQVVYADQSGEVATNSTSLVWSNVTATISLTDASNSVLCFVQIGGEYHGVRSSGGHMKLYYKETGTPESAGGTSFSGWSQVFTSNPYLVYQGVNDMEGGQSSIITKEARISNTNAHTFQLAFRTRSSSYFYLRHQNDMKTSITLMEI